jgi:predicted outer membrane protein
VKNVFLPKRLSARLFAAYALVAAAAVTPAAAQTGPEAAPPPAASPAPSGSSSSELVSHFVASAVPTANFIATASRLAISNSRNGKIQKVAETLARDQTAVANSLAAWVNVNGPVVTLRSPLYGKDRARRPQAKRAEFAAISSERFEAPLGVAREQLRCALYFRPDGGLGPAPNPLSRLYPKWHRSWVACDCDAGIAEGGPSNFDDRQAVAGCPEPSAAPVVGAGLLRRISL